MRGQAAGFRIAPASKTRINEKTPFRGLSRYFFFFALHALQVPQVQALALGLPLPNPG